MAYNKAPAFTVMALILLAAANPPLAHAQSFNQINAVGQVCCTATGSCPGGPPIPGVVVSLNCSRLVGATVTLGQATTNATGFFNISVPNTLGILASGNILPCVIAIKLPLNQTICPLLNTATGTVAGLLTFVNSLLSSLVGLIGNFAVLGFLKVTLPV
ncbi:hypothetical protein C2S53_014550 [Perilla frutescens var. hirtella]|uniref:Uncharacterized protein n=1 Tax=Perilla frutescens var. hirtella TaxID=608512 RepID=A0AAD4JCT6_PERFH|nr:hypothetical protein C2S53_014550 [Perilla frutescens var. hirtella]